MASALFDLGREGFLAGEIDWDTATVKAVLVDLDQAGPATDAWVISGVTNVANPTITTVGAHGLAVGDRVAISGVVGATGVNGNFDVATVPTSTTFTITASAPGAYTSGGRLMDLSLKFLSEIAAAGRISTTAALTSKTVTKGVADAADTSWTGVAAISAGNQRAEGFVLVQTSAVGGGADVAVTSQRLISWHDDYTGLPVLPNSGDVNLAFPNDANRIFKL